MSYRPNVVNVTKAGIDEKEGLYEFIVDMADGTVCRVFYHRFPEWKISHVTRLQKLPCPICRKDFNCECFDKFKDDIDRQFVDEKWFDKVLA